MRSSTVNRRTAVGPAARAVPETSALDSLPVPNGSSEPFDAARFMTIALAVLLATQMLAFPFAGSQIAAALPILAGTLALMAYRGRAVVDYGLLLIWMPMIALAAAVQLFARDFSITSFALFAVLYGMLCVRIRISREEYERLLQNVVRIALVIAGTVILQHTSQFLGGPFFDARSLLPDQLAYDNYVYRQPLYWGSPYEKPNGILLLEASVTSQLLALGFIIELIRARRAWVLITLLVTLAGTFAGTGLLMVALTAPLLLLKVNRNVVIVALFATPLLLLVLLEAGWVDIVLKRLGEFGQEGTSANARFAAPAELMMEILSTGDLTQLLFGIGAGQLPQGPDILWWATTKVMAEYGLLVFALFMAYNLRWLYIGRPDFVVAWAIGWFFHVLNGALLVPAFIAIAHLVVGAYVLERATTQPTRRESG